SKAHQWLQSKNEEKEEETNKDKTSLDNFQGNSEKSEENTTHDAESAQNKNEKEKGEDSSAKNESFDANTLKS
ncbi:MAG TPA: hypothetical protein DCM59_02385, partial [Clostridium sp.]|nr:hypothetical protein [Clostridium sp.]